MSFFIIDVDGATQAPGSAAPVRGVQILGQDGTNSRALLLDTAGRTLARLVDSSGYSVAVQPAVAVPANTPTALAGATDGTNARYLEVRYDAIDALYRLAVSGKFVQIPPSPPPSTTPVAVVAPSVATDPVDSGGTGLSVAGSSSVDTEYVIPNGQTLTLQYALLGAQGDPNERGARVELIYDQNGTLKLISRFYLATASLQFSFETSTTRDGTTMIGNVGGTNRLLIRRTRLSGGSGEIDVYVKGYVV